jgi:PadR family transcriptional regulator PadR
MVEADACYGYDIVRRLSEIKGLFATEATVYRILPELRKRRLIRASQQKSPIGPPRKYYEITGRGREELGRLRHFWGLVREGVDAVGQGRGRPERHRGRA